MFVVFDLDGTLADITHRVGYVRDGKSDWDSFFKACSDDILVEEVANTLHSHVNSGDSVEIWSARSDVVLSETRQWLEDNGINPNLLTRMREAKDSTPDVDLKRQWLHSLHPDEKPRVVYDDRQRVVDMWRDEEVKCFQVVANWENDVDGEVDTNSVPMLTLLIGPSGAGKSTYANDNYSTGVISSDELRHAITGDFRDQSRNDDVFKAVRKLTKARLECGLSVTIDATNLRRRDRLSIVNCCNVKSKVRYVVIDRGLEEKRSHGGWRNDVIMRDGKTLVENHHERFKSCLPHILRGDEVPGVLVRDLRGYL